MEKGSYAVLLTDMGTITVRLFSDTVPKAVDNFIGLAIGKKTWTDPTTAEPTHRSLYNGTNIFNVIPGFLIRGGSPLNRAYGGPGFQFETEISSAHFFSKAGLMAMANSGPDTNGSQFFITLVPAPWFNDKYTIFGEVIEGLDVVQAISRVACGPDGSPVTPVVLKEVIIQHL